jgi:hypothetical protein
VSGKDSDQDLRSVADWFRERGFSLEIQGVPLFRRADLRSVQTSEITAPSYGRGRTKLAAAGRAKARYDTEQ